MQPASLYKFQSSKFALIQLVYQPYPCIKEGPNFFSMGDQISTGNEYPTVNTYALCGLGLVSDILLMTILSVRFLYRIGNIKSKSI